MSADQQGGHEPGPREWPWPGPARPGDLSRRVSHRRKELGLSTEQLAARAGMSARYLEYVERSPSQLTVAALHQLAAALETTPDELLGGNADLPPGRGLAASHPVLTNLTAAECYRLLEPGGVGRVGFATAEGPVMLPVNFVMSARTVIFRTAEGDFAATHADGSEAGFEVDHLDEAMRQGWSVLVTGRAERVSDPGELRSLREQAPIWPWAGGEREVPVRITPDRISGRRIQAS